jgi:hypothetical protein
MFYTSGGQTTARGPTPARHHLISGPQKSSCILYYSTYLYNCNILHLRKKKFRMHFFMARDKKSCFLWPEEKKVWPPLFYTI